jgi:hypothetical protein
MLLVPGGRNLGQNEQNDRKKLFSGKLRIDGLRFNPNFAKRARNFYFIKGLSCGEKMGIDIVLI